MGNTGARARGEHVRRVACGSECNKKGKSGDVVIRGPEGRGGVKRGEGWEVTLSQAAACFTVDDGVIEGLSHGAAPGAGGGSVLIVPGRMGC